MTGPMWLLSVVVGAAHAALGEDITFAASSASSPGVHAGAPGSILANDTGKDEMRLSVMLVADGMCENQRLRKFRAALDWTPEECTVARCADACQAVKGCRFFEFGGFAVLDALSGAGLCDCYLKTVDRVDACNDTLPHCCGDVNATTGVQTYQMYREGALPDVVLDGDGIEEFTADKAGYSARSFLLNGTSGVQVDPIALGNFATRDQRKQRDFGVSMHWESLPEAVHLTVAEDAGRTVVARAGSIQDGFSNPYPNDMHQSIVVMGRDCRLEFKYLHVEDGTKWYTGACPYDYVEIHSFQYGPYVPLDDPELPPVRIGKYCNVEGVLPAPIDLAGNGFRLTFHTNEDTPFDGFAVEFACGVAAETPVPAAATATPPSRSVGGTPMVERVDAGRVFFSRGTEVRAVAYANGVVDFQYYGSRCVTKPQRFLYTAFRSYRVDFRKFERTLYVTLDGDVVCQAPVHDNAKHYPVAKGDYDLIMRAHPRDGGHRPASHHPSATHGCYDTDTLAVYTGAAYERTAGGADLCSARCYATYRCRWFRMSGSDSSSSCELLRDCTQDGHAVADLVTNASADAVAVYKLTPGVQFGVPTKGEGNWYQLKLYHYCMASTTRPPQSGDAVLGQRCTPPGDTKDLDYTQMFHLAPTNVTGEVQIRAVFDAALCVTCDAADSFNPVSGAQCVLAACADAGTARYRKDPTTAMLEQVGTAPARCLEYTENRRWVNDVPDTTLETRRELALRRCRGTATQRVAVHTTPKRRVRYIWRHDTGMLKWHYTGTSKWPYQATEYGVQPTPNEDYNVTTPPIPAHPLPTAPPPVNNSVVTSPPFCGPLASASVWVFGYAGNASASPGDPGYLGVLLREVSTGTVLHHYQLPTNTEFPGVEVKWTNVAGTNAGDATAAPPCFTMELHDQHELAIGVHDADFVLLGREEALHCAETTGVRLRTLRENTPLHVAEIKAYAAGDGSAVAVVTTGTGGAAATSASDGDDATWYSTTGEFTTSVTGIWTAQLLSHVEVTLGCPGGDNETCYAMQSNLVVEVLGADDTTVVRHMRLLHFDFDNGQAVMRFCGTGSHVPSLPLAGTEVPSCQDDGVDSLKHCAVVSPFVSSEVYYMRIDLRNTMPVTLVRYFTSELPRARSVWVGSNPTAPALSGNTRCGDVHEEGLEPPCTTCFLTNYRSDIACNLVGRYVYIVADQERSLRLHEVDVFVTPYDVYNDASVADGPYTFPSTAQYGRHADFPDHLGAMERRVGTWSGENTACTLYPVEELRVFDVPCSLEVDVVLSTSRTPDADTNAVRFHLSNNYNNGGDTYIQSGSPAGGMTNALVRSGCVSGTSFSLRRVRGGVYWSLGGTYPESEGMALNTTQALYGCVQIENPGVAVSYVATPCYPDDEVCTGAMDVLGSDPLEITPDSVGLLSDVVVDQNPALVTVPVRRHVAQTGTGHVTPHRDPFYAALPEAFDPPSVCAEGYTLHPHKEDAVAGLDGVWIEFNVTEDAWVTLFFDRPAARPWVAKAGWRLLSPLDAARAAPRVEFSGLMHSSAAIRRVEKGELVQIQGGHAPGWGDAGHLQHEPLARPAYICVRPVHNATDGPQGPAPLEDATSSLIFYETFDQYFGECATKDVINPGDAYRNASSFLWRLNTPGEFYHKGTLDRDNSSAWTAENRGVLGDWYQIEYNGTGTTLIIGVVVQGKEKAYDPTKHEWVTEFTVATSEDGVTFVPVDGGRAFPGNTDPTSHVRQHFSNPVYARYVRIYPTAWHGGMSLRAALVKCGFPLPLHTGLQLTGGCLAEVSNEVKVEGHGALHLQSPCTANATIEYPAPGLNPSHISLYGRSTHAEVDGAWVITFDVVDVEGNTYPYQIRTAGGGDLTFNDTAAGSNVGLRVYNDTWFAASLVMVHHPNDPGLIVNVHWAVDTMPGAAPLRPVPGRRSGVLPVQWRAITKVVFQKDVQDAESYFDAFEIWGEAAAQTGDMAHHPAIFSFDEPDLVSAARECPAYVAYETDGDFSELRLTALHRPHLLRAHCIEECCLLNWCTGVMVPRNGTGAPRGCHLLRRGVAVPDPDLPATGHSTFLLKLTVFEEVSGARRPRHAPEISEQALRSYPLDEFPDKLSTGTDQMFVNGRDHASVAYTYRLEVKGSFKGVSPEVMVAGLTSRDGDGYPQGFNALRSEIMRGAASVNMTAFPPFIDVSLYSTPNYTIPDDEVLVFTFLEEHILNVSDATVLTKGGRLFGLNSAQPLTVRANAECDGTRVCGGRRCLCNTPACLEAYVCSCEYPPDDLVSPYGHHNSSVFSPGDPVFVHTFFEGVQRIQAAHGLWDDAMSGYIGQHGTIAELQPAGSDVVSVLFPDATVLQVHTAALVATNGLEICKFSRRPPHWVH
eukprot:TRINITY_DN2095_c1_g2_i1.p1 TRINITY_DN2095_c1_g2~~TRINITY_DN2095_c1_g2_i1.p1  ORF type:complete len:2390 (+),score=800.10 TRINITY_DN2095_c1_g2_i1:72-7172(+)